MLTDSGSGSGSGCEKVVTKFPIVNESVSVNELDVVLDSGKTTALSVVKLVLAILFVAVTKIADAPVKSVVGVEIRLSIFVANVLLLVV